MQRGLLLTSLLLLSQPTSAMTNTNWSNISQLEQAVERLGARVQWSRMNKGDCVRQGLLGFYRPNSRTVLICQQRIRDFGASLIEILQHESWHAVQDICNGNRAVLNDNKIRSLLTEEDKKMLRTSYRSDEHRLEAEARALEGLPLTAFLKGVNHYCIERISLN